jgi:hypothetical protein
MTNDTLHKDKAVSWAARLPIAMVLLLAPGPSRSSWRANRLLAFGAIGWIGACGRHCMASYTRDHCSNRGNPLRLGGPCFTFVYVKQSLAVVAPTL